MMAELLLWLPVHWASKMTLGSMPFARSPLKTVRISIIDRVVL
jgi:hypothetical protein